MRDLHDDVIDLMYEIVDIINKLMEIEQTDIENNIKYSLQLRNILIKKFHALYEEGYRDCYTDWIKE